MKSWIWSHDRFLPCDSVPLADRGFRYGMSVFESLPVRNSVPIFLREHLARLTAASARCGFRINGAALAACEDLLVGSGNGFARVYITAGDGSVTGDCEHPRVFVFVEPREPTPARVYHRGYDLGIAPEPHQPLFGGLKTANYWANLEAFRAGVLRKKNETLLFNPRSELISACMANVFLIRDGCLQTPALASGARHGVLREWVLARRAVEERALTRADLAAAEEIFLTSSWLGIMPVSSLEDHPLATRSTAAALREEYHQSLSLLR